MPAVAMRELACGLLRASGIPLLVRETLQKRRVTILAYHRLTPTVADVHFTILRRYYNPIRLQQYLDARRTNTLGRLPSKSVVVTIDDGHRSIYGLKDVFAKHRIPVTVFLCSGFVESGRRFWFSAPGLQEAQLQKLKTVPDHVRVDTLRAMGFDHAVEFGEREALALCEIRDLQPMVNFEAHSVTHPILSQCSDAKSQSEITTCRIDLERWLGATVKAFAYPNGSYSAREVKYVAQAGYDCGITTRPGFNTQTTPAYELRRFVIPDDCGPNELLARTSGVWSLLRRGASAASSAHRN
jgi:peptidoglycan/xylan/chitin deacetylase (PgdA/CDA1 family)